VRDAGCGGGTSASNKTVLEVRASSGRNDVGGSLIATDRWGKFREVENENSKDPRPLTGVASDGVTTLIDEVPACCADDAATERSPAVS